MAQALGSPDAIQLGDRGPAADDSGEGDVAITPPAVTLPPPGPQGPVELIQARPITSALVDSLFRPPSS